MKANANKKKYNKVKLEKEARSYQVILDKEINKDRIEHGKKPFDMSKKNRIQRIKGKQNWSR